MEKKATFMILAEVEQKKLQMNPFFQSRSNYNLINEYKTSDMPIYLQVHHLYYVLSRLPWEYPNAALKTLCIWCHWDLHKKNSILAFRSEEESTHENLTSCYRCNGAGVFPEYSHIQQAVCFRCHGKLYEELIK